MKIAIIGAGRAGTSFEMALEQVGHQTTLLHHDELEHVPVADLVLLTVPDDHIAEIALQLRERDGQVVAHAAGSRSLDVLGPHARVGSMHPLAPLPSAHRGAARLLGATYSVAGEALLDDVVQSLGGRILRIADAQRTAYHATASVAANHLVALLGHVRELAETAGLSLEDFLPLVHMALADVVELGPDEALTGPASRRDMATIDAHLAAIPESQRSTYVALANAAFELAEERRSQQPA